jgi:hypothetical protein
MSTPSGPADATLDSGTSSPKEQFLRTLDEEFGKTLRVLRAYPVDRADLRPHPRIKTARELAWTFALERMLGIMVFRDEFVEKMGSGESPPAPENWSELLGTFEKMHGEYRALILETPETDLHRKVRFLTGPRTIGEISRLEWIWFLLKDEIHHRGQFSIYLRMADGKVPSIYGPTADEPWT